VIVSSPSGPPWYRWRRWLRRARYGPVRLEAVERTQQELVADLATLDASVQALAARLETPLTPRRELDDLTRLIQQLSERFAIVETLSLSVFQHTPVLESAVVAQGELTRAAVADAGREAAYRALVESLGPAAALHDGLSMLTIAWNHAGFLDASVTSALAALDTLPADEQGEVIVIDDASTDETATVLTELGGRDARVRVVRASSNLGWTRARNVALHACTTRHALMLDADNQAEPDGVAAVCRTAREWDAAFTYGTVIVEGGDSEPRCRSNEPLVDAYFDEYSVDALGVLGVEIVRAAGGYTHDPVLQTVDDQELLHRLARRGDLIGFVPVVVGRYFNSRVSASATTADLRPALRRLVRAYRSDGLAAEEVAAFAAHPVTGPLWMSKAAAVRRPLMARRLDLPSAPVVGPVREAGRLLVVAPGGVHNVGDDAITVAVVARLRRVAPDAAIALVTDGAFVDDSGPGVEWLGTRRDVVAGDGLAGLDPLDLSACVLAGGGNLNDLWRDGLVRDRVAIVRALAAAGVPVVASGQGIGPVTEPATRSMLGELVDGLRALGTRDAASRDLVRSLAPDLVCEVVADDAVGLVPGSADDVAAWLRDCGVAAEPGGYLAFHARCTPYVGVDRRWLDELARAVDDLACTRGLSVLGVAGNDAPPRPEALLVAEIAHGGALRRARWGVVEILAEAGRYAGVLAGAAGAVVHSYHAALLTLAAGKPALLAVHSPYYEHKAGGLQERFDLPDQFVLRGDADLDGLGERLDAVAARLTLHNPAGELAERADQWMSEALASARRPVPVDAGIDVGVGRGY